MKLRHIFTVALIAAGLAFLPSCAKNKPQPTTVDLTPGYTTGK